MGRKSNSTLGYGFLAIVAVFVWLFTNKTFWIIAGCIVAAVILGFVIYYIAKKRKTTSFISKTIVNESEEKESRTYAVFTDGQNSSKLVKMDISAFPSDIPSFLAQALEQEAAEDFLKARVSYMQAVERLKRCDKKEYDKYIEPLQKLYDEFVLRDPYYKKLMKPLLLIIEKNNGILQSEITKHFETSSWGTLTFYNRPVMKDDIYYALYFASRFGHIVRLKQGRSYKLFLPGTEPKDVK